MKSKGAVPIAYIIALLLGIAVLAVIGYWFFIGAGQLGGEITITQCRAKAQNYCNSWKAMSYGETAEVPNVGWFSDRYMRCADFSDDLGFSEVEDQKASDDEIACRNLINDLEES